MTETFTVPSTTTSARRPAKDAVLAAAVDQAREALLEGGAKDVGDHLGMVLEADRLATHYFAATSPGYEGWRWYVTVSRISRSRTATVCESGLLPGDGALLAPAWLPWADRLAPGDLGPTDRLPYVAEDERLEPGYLATGDPEEDRIAIAELGLGRDRVMNRKAIDAAASRWYAGSQGPDTAGTKAAGANCAECGFIVRIAGSLGTVFGVCANEWSPDDGKVVALDHGCGAHSETDVPPQGHEWQQSAPHLDETDIEVVAVQPAAPSGPDAEPSPEEDPIA
ncbi:DUF3027 domain-containing protein [Occultella aeris]|uniref:DUF3027 domain-containing protein n=1 Tax=Occultella aeris TaxID=2761496 RepID=A0A7M4DJI9_9MICO|nr:DUF3027 domain-containing protein [Occultella aeris]VZO37208.1 hypothetical protein HALOF300_02296 [Occultella aeris]